MLVSGDPSRDHPGPAPGTAISSPMTRAAFPRTPQKLGQMLAGQVDRFHGEPPLTLRAVAESHNSTRLYRVERWEP